MSGPIDFDGQTHEEESEHHAEDELLLAGEAMHARNFSEVSPRPQQRMLRNQADQAAVIWGKL